MNISWSFSKYNGKCSSSLILLANLIGSSLYIKLDAYNILLFFGIFFIFNKDDFDTIVSDLFDKLLIKWYENLDILVIL